ncbi:MAG: hypothetical protein MUE60_03720, partial [Candidatus Eisenbacteria bacterium]|nr:hypothetical protein [Candidatus Eisenbacteria bacterium]
MLPYIAAGFGLGLLLYPWLSPAQGILSLSQEMARQFVLLGITLFIAANVKGALALKRIPIWLPACIAALAALLVRSTVLAGLPFVPGDEDEYLFQARIFARGHVTAPAPPHAERFWAPGILIHGARWFGHHQPGHSLLLAAGVVLGIPGIIPAVSTGLTVLLLSMTARRLAGPDAGALTALLAMTSPMLLLTGATLVSETTSLLAVAAIFWLAVAEPFGRRSLLLAGLMVGWLLNVRLMTGISAGLATMVLLGARFRFLLPGIGVGIAGMMAHN